MSVTESFFKLLISKIKIIGEYLYSHMIIGHHSLYIWECPERTVIIVAIHRELFCCLLNVVT